jgi:dipeptidase E
MKLLLLSNSTNYGEPYLGWCKRRIADFLKGCENLCFIPFAGVSISYSEYEEMVNKALSEVGLKVTSLHHSSDPISTLKNSDAILTGGGNTFHLLKEMYDRNIIDAIRDRVSEGVPYVGWSAGSNVAGPSINTTNDMPIVEPRSFKALDLIQAQLNPHYTEKTIEGHGGESRLQRLKEFMQVSQLPVLALPESSGIEVRNESMRYFGASEMKLLRKGTEEIFAPDSAILL